MFKPTKEQELIQNRFTEMMARFDRSYRIMLINAGAGTGKTTTLVQLAESVPEKKGKFLAFNKAIVASAKAKMPKNVGCSTFHGYFFGIVGKYYQGRSSKVSAQFTADFLGIKDDLELSEKNLTPVMLARIIYRAINKFSMSDDLEISSYHIPWIRGLNEADMDTVKATLVPYLRRAWKDIADVHGQLRFKPENYIKIGALQSPKIAASFVMVDEAQDLFPVIIGWLKRQPHIRLVITGDSAQAINEWTGAIDSMNKFDTDPELILNLTKSFRFGEELADEANRWLYVINQGDFFISGNENKTTIVTDYNEDQDNVDAILCRTNAGVISAALHYVSRGVKCSMSERNQEDIKDIAKAAMQLMAGTSVDHEDFAAFQSWDEVLDYVENDPGGEDIKTIVKLIQVHGPSALLELVENLVPQSQAETIILTAHTSKGLEFDVVEIWNDFPDPAPSSDGDPEDIPLEYARLAYVAVTRAMRKLIRGSLSVIDDYVVFEDEEEEEDG